MRGLGLKKVLLTFLATQNLLNRQLLLVAIIAVQILR
jgi:hypothetical protein